MSEGLRTGPILLAARLCDWRGATRSSSASGDLVIPTRPPERRTTLLPRIRRSSHSVILVLVPIATSPAARVRRARADGAANARYPANPPPQSGALARSRGSMGSARGLRERGRPARTAIPTRGQPRCRADRVRQSDGQVKEREGNALRPRIQSGSDGVIRPPGTETKCKNFKGDQLDLRHRRALRR